MLHLCLTFKSPCLHATLLTVCPVPFAGEMCMSIHFREQVYVPPANHTLLSSEKAFPSSVLGLFLLHPRRPYRAASAVNGMPMACGGVSVATWHWPVSPPPLCALC